VASYALRSMLFEVGSVSLSIDFLVLCCAIHIGNNRTSYTDHFQVSIDAHVENIHHGGYNSQVKKKKVKLSLYQAMEAHRVVKR
jgi:hypothetical protein